MKLTDTSCRNAKAKDKTYKLFDGGGLYLEVTSSNRKYWRLKYRLHGKEKRYAIGVYPGVSLKAARDEREAAKKLIAEGVDPVQRKQLQKSLALEANANTFKSVAFARIDDNRFDFNLDQINNENVTIAIQDDAPSEEIRNRDFPDTKTVSMSQLSPVEELLLLVKEGKADVTFDGAARLKGFDKSHPATLKVIPSEKPLRIYANTVAVDIGEQKLLHVLDTTIKQLHDDGIIDKIIDKYSGEYPEKFLIKIDRPYKYNK